MKIRLIMASAFVVGVVSLAVASSKISDESYRLLRQLVSYKNREINDLHSMSEYLLDCHNVSDEQLAAKKCSERLAAMQSEDRDLQVKHDVLGQEIASHIRQHHDEEWLFMGLMLDDKEFSNLAH
jgi:formate-dependent nitrite reductase cytochrome c552 subunit